METLFTAGDVCAVSGIAPKMLERWTLAGLVRPANNRRGKGRHRLYGLGDVVAVAAGIRSRDAGADYDRVPGIVRFLSGLGVTRLERELAAGRTFPVPGAMFGVTWMPGLMIEPPTGEMSPGAALLIHRLNLATIYADVRKKVEELTEAAKVSN